MHKENESNHTIKPDGTACNCKDRLAKLESENTFLKSVVTSLQKDLFVNDASAQALEIEQLKIDIRDRDKTIHKQVWLMNEISNNALEKCNVMQDTIKSLEAKLKLVQEENKKYRDAVVKAFTDEKVQVITTSAAQVQPTEQDTSYSRVSKYILDLFDWNNWF